MNYSRDKLRHARASDTFLDIDTYNGMVDVAKSYGLPSARGGYSEQFGQAVRRLRPKTPSQAFINNDGTDCPPFGVGLEAGGALVGGSVVAIPGIKQCTSWGCQDDSIVNGPLVAKASGFGFAQVGDYVVAAYDNASIGSFGGGLGGMAFGPVSGSWLLKFGVGGFRMVFPFDFVNHWALVRRSPMRWFYGKSASRITKSASTGGTVNIYTWNNTFNAYVDTGSTMTNVLARFGDIAAGAFVECFMDEMMQLSPPIWFAVETDLCP